MVYVRKREPWALALAAAIKKYADQHGINRSEIRKELGLPEKRWNGIRSGSRVSVSKKDRGETYALLFYRYGIKEADPRTIPPLQHVAGKYGKTAPLRRAWTEPHWKAWVAKQEKRKASQASISPRVAQRTEGPLETELRRIIREELTTLQSSSIKTRAGLQRSSGAVHRIDTLAKELLDLVLTYDMDDDAGLDELYRSHGTVLGDLVVELDKRLQPREERKKVRQVVRMKEALDG